MGSSMGMGSAAQVVLVAGAEAGVMGSATRVGFATAAIATAAAAVEVVVNVVGEA